MKCKICGKIEGFDGSFFTLICQNCLNEFLNKKVDRGDKMKLRKIRSFLCKLLNCEEFNEWVSTPEEVEEAIEYLKKTRRSEP